MKQEMVNVRLPKDMWEKIKHIAKMRRRSATGQLQAIIEVHLIDMGMSVAKVEKPCN